MFVPTCSPKDFKSSLFPLLSFPSHSPFFSVFSPLTVHTTFKNIVKVIYCYVMCLSFPRHRGDTVISHSCTCLCFLLNNLIQVSLPILSVSFFLSLLPPCPILSSIPTFVSSLPKLTTKIEFILEHWAFFSMLSIELQYFNSYSMPPLMQHIFRWTIKSYVKSVKCSWIWNSWIGGYEWVKWMS